MKIAIGCDHAAYNEKSEVVKFVENLDFEVIDCGTNSLDSVDYPEFGKAVGMKVKHNEADRGIVLCGSGIGISIAANKVKGIRAALCTSVEHAIMSRKHNDANVISLGARMTSLENIKLIIKAWLDTEFEGGRHQKRIEQIEG